MKKERVSYMVKENQFRLMILNNYYMKFHWLKEYDNVRDELIDYTSNLITPLSLSTNCLRLKFLHDKSVKDCNYHLSRIRLDTVNSLLSEINNSKTVFKLMKGIDSLESKYLFVTVNFAHLLDYQRITEVNGIIDSKLLSLKNNLIPDLIQGLISKYELSYSVRDNLLYLNPHVHLLIKTKIKDSDTLTEYLKNYFTKFVESPENDFNIKSVNNSDLDYKKLANYICKDYYKQLFHYDITKIHPDYYNVPYTHIAYLCYKSANRKFLKSYKELRFSLYQRKGVDRL